MAALRNSDSSRLTRLEKRLVEKGVRLTPLRRLVLSILIEAEAPIKAYDLLESARSRGQRLTPTSIYRVLDFLQESGLIHRVNSLNAFVLCNDSHRESSHHPVIVVCPGCGKTTEINDAALAENLSASLVALGHPVEMVSIEVHGVCPICLGK
ncbi:MAG: transcriptional repressor [Deltaproteobacteria bacterium]|jgi:Fur family zinc uptake transcriptional regulator|nr:transcriptional repressor [Deltaproteobacteria bacterium]